MYWLVNTGTIEDPWLENIVERYCAWSAVNGDVQMFPFRPAQMAVGDVLIHRIVGTPQSELVAVGQVKSLPEKSRNERWPWQVERRLLYDCDSLSRAPTAEQAGITAKGLRVMKRLSDDQGQLAESLIVAAGRQFALA